MLITKKFAIMLLLLLSVGSVVWSQVLPTPPTVYVSGGATIYSVTVATGAVTPIFTSANASSNFESLAIGPDNAFTDTDGAGNAAHPYLLYACDTGTNSIIRFDPTAALPITPQTVASGLAFPPECGRSTATSDVYVTNKNGPGVYLLTASSHQTCTQMVALPQTVPVGCFGFTAASILATPVKIDNTIAGMTGRGLAQKYIGDLLVVDNANNQVLHSAYGTGALPLFTTLSGNFIATNLNGPVGVVNAPSLLGANNTPGQILVSNSNSVVSKATPAEPAVSIFDASGAPSTTTCPTGLSIGKSNQVPGFLATAPTDQFPAKTPNTIITDTIYLVTSANSGGTLWTWNKTAQAGKCNLVSVATTKAPLSGVAVPPAPVTLTLPLVANVPTNFLFNSNLFQLTATQACSATVTAYPFSLVTVNSMIGLESPAPPNPQTPSVNLGDGGFQTIYESFNPQCGITVPPNDTTVMLIANFVDPGQSLNPRYLDCHNSDQTVNNHTEPKLENLGVTACQVAPTLGSYPLGGPISGDYGGKLSNFFAMVNESATTSVNNTTNPPGRFCGFDPPLSGDGSHLPNPPSQLNGNSITVKFKAADLSQGGSCQSGPYLNGQTALLSVAQICNTTPSNDPFCGPGGSPVFNAINLSNNATSSQPALFTDTNNQFKFSLLIGGFASGTYSLTVTFLTDNTTNQTTVFTIP